jgi:hypothetical protein
LVWNRVNPSRACCPGIYNGVYASGETSLPLAVS